MITSLCIFSLGTVAVSTPLALFGDSITDIKLKEDGYMYNAKVLPTKEERKQTTIKQLLIPGLNLLYAKVALETAFNNKEYNDFVLRAESNNEIVKVR